MYIKRRLWNEMLGLRAHISCVDHVNKFRIIEQLVGWRTSLNLCREVPRKLIILIQVRRPIINTHGVVTTAKEEQVWKGHYEKLLSATDRVRKGLCTRHPDIPKIESAIDSLKSNKAP